MALKVTKKGVSGGVSMSDMMATYQKDFGKEIMSVGGTLVNSERIPSGLFPLDLALGGGLPRAKVSIIFGPESSGKTNIALKTIANHQRLWPKQVCVFFDVENSFDPAWAKILGVDVDKLIVVKPSYGEQLVDMVEGFLYSDDCGVVVVDSLAALIATAEIEGDAAKSSYGGNSILIGKMVRKTTLALLEAEKKGRYPTLIYINQTRNAIGKMFGPTEDMPGGNAPRFQANIILRTYGKNIIDKKISEVMPVIKETTFIVRKWKTPIVAANGVVSMIAVPHDGMKPGEVDDWNTISEYIKNFGKWEKGPKNKGWMILDELYPTQQAFRDRLENEPDFKNEVRTAIIQRVLQDATLLEASNEVEGTFDGGQPVPDAEE